MDVGLLSLAGDALSQLLTAQHLSFLLIGVGLGLCVGLLPGLGGIAGMSLLLPFVYGLEPGAALGMMVGMSAVTTTSDTFPSVLMGVPGSSGSQATVLDGFPLSKNGQGARALSAAFASSLVGGLIGAVALSASVIVARPVLMQMGFGEQLMLVLLGLTFVGMLTGPSIIKGLVACCIGLLIGTVGIISVTAQRRMTFSTDYLFDGIPLVVMGLGLFAIPEVLDVLRHRTAISEKAQIGSGWLAGFRDVLHNRWLVLRCGLLGSLVGALPGLGGTVVDWIAYGHTIQSSKNTENFGKGDIRGVIGPESANNAKEGGALIPTLFLGIPGSGTMALLLGGLVIIGINPGRNIVTHHLDIVYLVIWSLALANVIAALICLGLAKPISRLTSIRYQLIAPFMLVIIFFAAFQASRSWGDMITLVVLGLIGVYMKRFGWPRAAVLIGFVLSTPLEDSVYRTVQIYGFDLLLRPVAMTLMVVAAICLFYVIRSRRRIQNSGENITTISSAYRLPQIVFAGLITIFVIMILLDSRNLSFLAYVFPVSVALFTSVLLIVLFFKYFFGKPSTSFFLDTEAEIRAEGIDVKPMAFYLAVFLSLPILSAIVGFTVAAPIFVAGFLRGLARALFLGVALWFLGDLLAMRYPQGWLSPYLI
jgi:putative tricarboxylic transport membrane protein